MTPQVIVTIILAVGGALIGQVLFVRGAMAGMAVKIDALKEEIEAMRADLRGVVERQRTHEMMPHPEGDQFVTKAVCDLIHRNAAQGMEQVRQEIAGLSSNIHSLNTRIDRYLAGAANNQSPINRRRQNVKVVE